jgi:hypothetical protein
MRRMGILLATILWNCCPAAAEPTRPLGGAAASRQTLSDEQYRRLAVGIWRDQYQGKRTMTLAEDGTGKMLVELDGLKARLFASRLEFQMEWRVEKGRLHKRTVGGEPAARVQMLLKTLGDRVDEPILELTERRLLLLDKDGKTEYDWRRVLDAEGDGP